MSRRISSGLAQKLCAALITIGISGFLAGTVFAQKHSGPMLPHAGGQVDYAISNRYGPDAEARVTFSAVTPQIDYQRKVWMRPKRKVTTAHYKKGRSTGARS